MFDFLKFKQAVAGLADEIAGLRGQIEEKKQRHEFLQTAPRAPEDLADQLDELIAAQAERWRNRLRAGLEPYRRKARLEIDSQKGLPLLAAVDKDQIPGPGAIEGALFSIFGDEIRHAIRGEIMTWDSADAGPRLAERESELAKLDEEIAELERREQALVDEARAAGIRI